MNCVIQLSVSHSVFCWTGRHHVKQKTEWEIRTRDTGPSGNQQRTPELPSM